MEYISRCVKLVNEPFYSGSMITVFSDGWIPLAHVASALNSNQQTLESKLKDGTEFRRYSRTTSPYKCSQKSAPVQNVISKAGLQRLLKEYIGWSAKNVQRAMDMLYSNDNKYTRIITERRMPRKSAAKSTHVSDIPRSKRIARKTVGKKVAFDDDSSSSSSLHASPPRKALPKKHSLDEEESSHLGSFMDELRRDQQKFISDMDERIGEQAVWYYQKTPEFQERLGALLQKEMDKMLPELRKQMEAKVRAELEPVIRKEVKKRVRSEVQAEVEPFRQKMFVEETQKVFSEHADEGIINASSFVSDVLKKRKFTE